MPPSSRSSNTSSSISSPTVSEGPRTPSVPPTPSSSLAVQARKNINVNDRRTSSLRASVFDAFAELGTFDENSQIAAWIFDPEVADDSSSSLRAGLGPSSAMTTPMIRNRNGGLGVHFVEKTGSRFRERLNSDASANLLNGYVNVKNNRSTTATKAGVGPAAHAPYIPPSTSPVATRRPARRFFNGLRARSASRNREDKRKKSDVSTEMENIPVPDPSPKKRPFLTFRSKASTKTVPTYHPDHHPSSLDIPRPRFLDDTDVVGSSSKSELSWPSSVRGGTHASTPSVATNASWVNIQGSASLDLLRTVEVQNPNPFLSGKPLSSSNAIPSTSAAAAGEGIPFPSGTESNATGRAGGSGPQILTKISSVVPRSFSTNTEKRSSLGVDRPIRRTQSRPQETTVAKMSSAPSPLRTNFAASFTTPQSATLGPRAMATMEVL